MKGLLLSLRRWRCRNLHSPDDLSRPYYDFTTCQICLLRWPTGWRDDRPIAAAHGNDQAAKPHV
jgi:hypothetical protein